MKLVFVRHADPDYENHTLTKKGFEEIEALGKHYSADDFDYVYSSPLTRAKLTAEAVIKGKKDIIYLKWLEEFSHFITIDTGKNIAWDFRPKYLSEHPELLKEGYLESDIMKTCNENIKEEYDNVISHFDELLASHGYKREGSFYKVTKPNEDTLVFFFHFGLMSVLMSRLLNIPYTIIAQYFCSQPTGVTTFVTQEREKGIAEFRCLVFGDVSHLKEENQEPAFAGRFCEMFDNKEQRH